MLRFRAERSTDFAGPVTLTGVRRLAGWALAPGHFCVAPGMTLQVLHLPAQERPWEIFRGRLLLPNQTRLTRTLEAWNLFLSTDGTRDPAPILSLWLDAAEGLLHVVRTLLCRVWEGYDAGGGVFLSREVERPVEELTGTIRLSAFDDLDELHDELTGLVFQAVVGVSRLPLTSLEAPLPAYTLGQFGYFHGAGEAPLQSWQALAAARRDTPLSWRETVKLLEMLLRMVPGEEIGQLAECLDGWPRQIPAGVALPGEPPLLSALRGLFNEISLSPWTPLAERVLELLRVERQRGRLSLPACLDFQAWLLRHLGRHLTAYDLVVFHHRGANYPDALLLEAVLADYLRLAGQNPGQFQGDGPARLRRRALRQAWLIRRQYEGHLVPDAPTSPGENARVLPESCPRVAEEQILNPASRTRKLYAGTPLELDATTAGLLRLSLEDLENPGELRELGTGLFLDRPLGLNKVPGEPDQTLLLSHLAFSRGIAVQRLALLRNWQALAPANHERLSARLSALLVPGVPLLELGGRPRPGAVSLADAWQASPDFVFFRTTRLAVRELFAQYDLSPLGLKQEQVRLAVPRDEGLALYDADFRVLIELRPDLSAGTVSRAGRELLAGGFRTQDRRIRPAFPG